MTDTARLTAVRDEAAELFALHGLTSWTFGFDSAKKRLGVCNSHKRSITLSRIFSEHGKPEDVTDTILHEIAHALVEVIGQPGIGHGKVWKAKARELGCNPAASAEAFIPPEFLISKGKQKRIYLPTEPGRKRLCKAQVGSLVDIPRYGKGMITSAGTKNFIATLDIGVTYAFRFANAEKYLVQDSVPEEQAA